MLANSPIKDNKSYLVSCYLIDKSNKEHKPITNKKLQKLLYYSQAWSLALSGNVIFKDDIEAWIHGPAVANIYFKFKKFGFNPISLEKKDCDFSKLSKPEIALLDSIWKVYGKYSAEYLEALTHSEKPWQEAREGLAEYETSKNVISKAAMKTYYEQKIK